MEPTAENVRELNVPACNLSPTSTGHTTTAGPSSINQVGDNVARKSPPTSKDVIDLDIMPQLISAKKQFATNVGK